jgi:alpha-tubulin suppressor-like RCC1 family protein
MNCLRVGLFIQGFFNDMPRKSEALRLVSRVFFFSTARGVRKAGTSNEGRRAVACAPHLVCLLLIIVAQFMAGRNAIAATSVYVWGDSATQAPANATNIVAIAAGTGHNLALRADGTVIGWGDDSNGQIDIPAFATNVVAIAGGEGHSMALRQDGTVVCWGLNNYNDTIPPASATNLVAIAAGQFHSLGLRQDGTVVGWGSDFIGESDSPGNAFNVIGLAAWGWWDSPIDPHNLALRADGSVIGWGYNDYGQSSPPPSATNVVAIAAGKYHSLALRQDGTVVAWGDNSRAQCTVPATVSNAVGIAAGEFHSLALLQNGALIAWGYDTNGSGTVPSSISNVVAITARHYRNLALSTDPGRPVIWKQPVDQAVPVSGTVLLNAEVIGTPAIKFQWYFNGVLIPAQTRNWLALSTVDVTRGGNYQLIATNDFGSVTSRVASIFVVPQFLVQPTNLTLNLGTNANFSVLVNGQEPLTYQWFGNGAPLADGPRIAGSTTASLTISNLQPSDAGPYQVVVTSPSGTNYSSVATLTLLLPPTIAIQPTNQTVSVGKNINVAVVANGTDPLAYQWLKDGVPVAGDAHLGGATSATLTIADVQTNYTGAYDVIITNNYGAITSQVANLTVLLREPNILVQPRNQYLVPTRQANFSVVVEGAAPFGYQWYHDGVALADNARVTGSLAAALSISNLQSSDGGSYWVVVSNSFGTATSSNGLLVIGSLRYVNAANPSPSAPYTNWATAAQTIQQAFDFGGPGDEIVVTNGTYSSGGRAVYGAMTNRIAADHPVFIHSVNGPQVTTIAGQKAPLGTGDGAFRCAYLTNDAVLAGFTLTSGATRRAGDWFREDSGGAVFCESISAVISNCIITGNLAAGEAGAVYSGSIDNCTISNNRAGSPGNQGEGGGTVFSRVTRSTISGNTAVWGGGAMYGSLTDCKIIGNSAYDPIGSATGAGGGAISASLTNCVVMNNTARVYGGGIAWGAAINCLFTGNSSHSGGGANSTLVINCTIVGNSAPFDGTSGGFGGGVDSCSVYNSIIVQNSAGWGGRDNNVSFCGVLYCCTPYPSGDGSITDDPVFIDPANGNYRLQTNSPCLNAGSNGLAGAISDLDDAPRIVDGAVDMGAFELQHFPFVLVGPTNQAILIHSNVTFVVVAEGDGPLYFQWQKDGVPLADDGRITGSTAATLQISSLVVSDAGNYSVTVSNSLGAVTTASANLTTLGLPLIVTSPASRSVPAGTNTTFTVSASGLGTLAYQWRFQGLELANSTRSSLSLTNVQVANIGNYDVVVTNAYGGVTSSVATLTVLPAAPIITLQPTSVVTSVSQPISFFTAAKGSEPLYCQWQKNGSNVAGANSLTFTLANPNSSSAGTYRALVSNSVGVAYTTNATLSVVPVIEWGATNVQKETFISLAPPANATNLVAIAAGRTSYSYPCLAIRSDGSLVGWGFSSREVAIPASATNVIAVAMGDTAGLGQGGLPIHSLAVRTDGAVIAWGNNNYGQANVPTNVANIIAVAAGTYHSLALDVSGNVFAWGRNVEGQTTVPPNATNVVAVAAGAYHSLALKADGTVIGWGKNNIGQATNLASASNIIAITAGGDQSLGLRADGTVVGLMVTNFTQTAQLGAPPPDATNLVAISAGSIHSLGLRPDGSVTGWGDNRYQELLIPPYGTNITSIAAGGYIGLGLVNDPTQPVMPITAPLPSNHAMMAGTVFTLRIAANGGGLHYQWQCNGTNVPGATASFLTLANADISQSGSYSVLVSNAAGVVRSTAMTVVIWPALNLGRVGNNSVVSWPGAFHLSSATSASGLYVDIPSATSPYLSDVHAFSSRFFRLDLPIGPVSVNALDSQNLLIGWSGPFTLQSSTNLAGPYLDVPGATHPYTNNIATSPGRFFRVRY